MTEKINLISSMKNGIYTLTELTHSDPDYKRAKAYDCENGGIEEGYELYAKTKDKEYSIATDPKSSDHIGKGVKLCTYAEPVVVKFYIGIPDDKPGLMHVSASATASAPDTVPSPAPGSGSGSDSGSGFGSTHASASASANVVHTPGADHAAPAHTPDTTTVDPVAPATTGISVQDKQELLDTILTYIDEQKLWTKLGYEGKSKEPKNIIMVFFPFEQLMNAPTIPSLNDDDYYDALTNYFYFIIKGIQYENILINASENKNIQDKYSKFDDNMIKNIVTTWKSVTDNIVKKHEHIISKQQSGGGSRNISSRYNYMFNKTQYKLL